MNSFLLDASAAVKRYTLEAEATLVDHLFNRTTPTRLMCLMLGAAEVAATLARKPNSAIVHLNRHSLNSTDCIVLEASLTVATRLRSASEDLVLVASDARLLKAARKEGLLTFNPETQDQFALDALLGP